MKYYEIMIGGRPVYVEASQPWTAFKRAIQRYEAQHGHAILPVLDDRTCTTHLSIHRITVAQYRKKVKA